MEGFGDNFTELDPAADFLAREQNELAGLEDDLNPATLNSPPEGKFRGLEDLHENYIQKSHMPLTHF